MLHSYYSSSNLWQAEERHKGSDHCNREDKKIPTVSLKERKARSNRRRDWLITSEKVIQERKQELLQDEWEFYIKRGILFYRCCICSITPARQIVVTLDIYGYIIYILDILQIYWIFLHLHRASQHPKCWKASAEEPQQPLWRGSCC